MKTWFPSILAALAAVAVALGPTLQKFVAGHPVLSAIVAALSVVFAHLAPSPLGK